VIDDRSPWDRPRLPGWLRTLVLRGWPWIAFVAGMVFVFCIPMILQAMGVNPNSGGSP
jgi:hypothetical protein